MGDALLTHDPLPLRQHLLNVAGVVAGYAFWAALLVPPLVAALRWLTS